MNDVNIKLNHLEQTNRKNNAIITGVPKTYAEHTAHALNENAVPYTTREDTISAVCSIMRESCNMEIAPADIKFAYRLHSVRNELRPILESLHSFSLRTKVVKSRRLRQQLLYHGVKIFIKNHITKINSDLVRKARLMVKNHEAHSIWTRDRQIFVKWSEHSPPAQVTCNADFD